MTTGLLVLVGTLGRYAVLGTVVVAPSYTQVVWVTYAMCATAALRTSSPPTGPRATLAFQWMAWQGFQRTGWPSRMEEKRYDAEVSAASLTVLVVVVVAAAVVVITGEVGIQPMSASGSDSWPIAWAVETVEAAVADVSPSVANAATARAARRRALGDML